MIEVTRQKTKTGYVISGNLKCPICKCDFEFIESNNGTAVVKQINMKNGKDESLDLEVTAKCNLCEYTSIYNLDI